jgi:hypothetical protein
MLESDCDTVQCCYCCLECCSCHMLQALCLKATVISAVTKERLCVAKRTCHAWLVQLCLSHLVRISHSADQNVTKLHNNMDTTFELSIGNISTERSELINNISGMA